MKVHLSAEVLINKHTLTAILLRKSIKKSTYTASNFSISSNKLYALLWCHFLSRNKKILNKKISHKKLRRLPPESSYWVLVL